jgi:Protein of unknown function (DUF1493)
VADALSDLSEWFEQFWGEKLPASYDEDLFARFGIDGDDAGDFMDSFAARFEVDIANYRWYFHHGEEGLNIAGLFFAPPNGRVKNIPITTATLLEAIQSRRWPLDYPAHKLPKVRWDVWLNLSVILLLFAFVAIVMAWRFLS